MPLMFWLSIVLLPVSLVLVTWNLAWHRRSSGLALTDEDVQFLTKQLRRRTAASSLLGIVGILMLIEWTMSSAAAKAFLLLGIASTLVLTLLLAATDWLATQRHWAKAGRDTLRTQRLLQAEIDRYRREQTPENSASDSSTS